MGSSAVSKDGETAYTQHYTTAEGSRGSVQTSAGGKAGGVSTAYGSTAAGKTASGNMYAGHDGNVYQNTGSGWEKNSNGSWNSVQKPQGAEQQKPSSFGGSGGGEEMKGLQQEARIDSGARNRANDSSSFNILAEVVKEVWVTEAEEGVGS